MAQSTDSLSWTVHPAREDPARAVVAATVALAFLVLVYLGWRSLGYCLIAAAALFLALQPFALPTTYTLSVDGVTVRTLLGTQRRAWEEFRTYRRAQGQIILCTRKIATGLDRFRGCRLVLSGNESETLAFVEAQGLEGR